MPLNEPGPMAQALAANRSAPTPMQVRGQRRCDGRGACYRVPTFESIGGRALAAASSSSSDGWVACRSPPRGCAYRSTARTRMPAVLFTIGPVRTVVDATPGITSGTLPALEL